MIKGFQTLGVYVEGVSIWGFLNFYYYLSPKSYIHTGAIYAFSSLHFYISLSFTKAHIKTLNSNLSILKYPAKRLHLYIESFKVYHFLDNEDVLLIPKGVFEIVFQSQHSFQHNTTYSQGWKLRPRNFIGGLHNQCYRVNSGIGTNYCIVVEFKPNTAKYFIPEKLDFFQNAIIDINDIWGKSSKILSQRIDKEKSDRLKIELIESFLLDNFKSPKPSFIDIALNNVIYSNGSMDVKNLAQKASLSGAQFRKRFKEEIGISPSQYCKIVRVNAALKMTKQKGKSLTELSYVLGYFDQSHFIKDFKSVIGLTPTKFQAL